MGHSGAIGYYAHQAALEGMAALTVCQSDPMVVPFGGTEPYFGTNPIAFSAPRKDGSPILLIWQQRYKPGENLRCKK